MRFKTIKESVRRIAQGCAFGSILAFLVGASPSFAVNLAYEVGEDVALVFEIFDLDDGSTVSGESPTVQVGRLSDGFWYDFDDGTFKSSGWVERNRSLVEIETSGRYEDVVNTTGWSLDSYVVLYSNAGLNQSEGTESFLLRGTTVGLCAPVGGGAVAVDHDYPNPDDQTFEDSFGAALPDVYIRVYTQANYNAGRLDVGYIEGLTISDVNGEWDKPIFLDPGDYITVGTKRGYATQTFEFTVVLP